MAVNTEHSMKSARHGSASRPGSTRGDQAGVDSGMSPPEGPATRSSGGSLTKVTVNLLPRTVAALEEASEAAGQSKTDTINRAVQLYNWIQRRLDAGESLQIVSQDGQTREIHIF